MRAARLEQFGKPSDLRVQEVPRPKAGPDQVLVEIRAAAVSPSDVKNVLGGMSQTTLPRTLGRDFSGVIVEGPAGRVGQEVWGTGGEFGYTQDGAHAEYLLTSLLSVGPKPGNLSMDEAAAAGTNYMAAWAGLMHAAQMKPGETVVVVGASGGVGSAVVQIAKWKGARVIGIERRDPPPPSPGQLRPDVTINTERQDARAGVLAATRGKGAAIVFDTVGGPQFEVSLGLLAHGGRLLEISSAGGRRVSFDLVDFYHNESRLFGVDTLHLDSRACAQLLAEFVPAFEGNVFQPPVIARRYSLDNVVEAYEDVSRGGVPGKIIVIPKAK